MATPILATKLYVPSSRSQLVHRPRLLNQLNEGVQGKLTLISAPAGFGKTTLVSDWIADSQQATAWLSLDDGDNDPVRFWTYFIVALQSLALNHVEGLAPALGVGALTMLQAPQPPTTESVLIVLLNEITAVSDNFTIVLDDYHLIDSQPIDKALTFLLEHLPPQIHLIMTTREDPNLPLARLRVRGQLAEIRVADLRFTPSEAADFFNSVMGLNLLAKEIDVLETRTEGWIAGLQMAALALRGTLAGQGQTNKDNFIQSFAGSHHFILDYLVEEVLLRQPEHVRDFLLQTAVLDKLRGSLCDAVTARTESKKMLKELERGNLFVIPLDDKREWYRYHHLFADVLKAHLVEGQSEQVATLHSRASVWYEQHDAPIEAIRHAVDAEDFERAADLLELVRPQMESSFQSAMWLGWVKALPEELLHARPVLSVGYGWALLDCGEMEASEARLKNAEYWLDGSSNEKSELASLQMIVVDHEEFLLLPASIAAARAYCSLALGDVPHTITYAQQALDLLPEGDNQWRGAAISLLGLAQYVSGNLEAADQSLTDFMMSMWQADRISDVISITFILADIKMALGRFQETQQMYQRALQLATNAGKPYPLGTADLYRGISELHRERGEVDVATQQLLSSETLGEQIALTDWQHRLCVTQARMKEIEGDLDSALDLLDEAERQHIRTPVPVVRPVAALRTRVWIKQGKLDQAKAWANEQHLAPGDELHYMREFEHITLAKLRIAQYKQNPIDNLIEEATELLARLLQAAESGKRVGSMIDILVLQTTALQAQNNIPEAVVSLRRALTLAEPERYVHVFVDDGQLMARLLTKLKDEGRKQHAFIDELLAIIKKNEAAAFSSAPPQVLLDPLSERELEVLKLLDSEMSGPEIARELVVSLNTMRTHTKNIYSKLGANNRRTAVRRAKELKLL